MKSQRKLLAPAAGAQAGQGGETASSKYLNIILIGMVLILLLLLIILALIVSALKRFLDQKELSEEDREVVHSPISCRFSNQKSWIYFYRRVSGCSAWL